MRIGVQYECIETYAVYWSPDVSLTRFTKCCFSLQNWNLQIFFSLFARCLCTLQFAPNNCQKYVSVQKSIIFDFKIVRNKYRGWKPVSNFSPHTKRCQVGYSQNKHGVRACRSECIFGWYTIIKVAFIVEFPRMINLERTYHHGQRAKVRKSDRLNEQAKNHGCVRIDRQSKYTMLIIITTFTHPFHDSIVVRMISKLHIYSSLWTTFHFHSIESRARKVWIQFESQLLFRW